MIHVRDLHKRFADLVAVDGVSFDVPSGGVLGFLGPNGAGKTTTMRVLTGFLPPSSGKVEVAGFDVATHSRQVRRRIGYLPEHVPLYPEMRVREYLDFRARLKRVPGRERAGNIAWAVDLCGLGAVRDRIIGQLSRGYRQRVGLADALCHKPPILILDEPTVGLDPNQIRDVRQLIKDLGKQHTILVSTHILPEVEMVCSQVVIIHRGKVVAQDTPEGLRAQVEGRRRVRVEVRGDDGAARGALEKIAGVRAIERLDGAAGADGFARFALEADADRDVREDVFRAIAAAGLSLRELHAEALSLEDVFHQITTREAA